HARPTLFPYTPLFRSRPLIFEQIIGLALLGSGSAFLAYKLSNARPTGRLGRASRRIRGLSPIIAVISALVLYFTVYSSIFGSSLDRKSTRLNSSHQII